MHSLSFFFPAALSVGEKYTWQEFMDPRRDIIQQWLTTACKLADHQLEVMAGDASFRRYFRVRAGSQRYVLMDAPPERETGCRSFVAIANSLRQAGLQAPAIIASDVEQGLLLLSDFGDRLYLRELTDSNVDHLYGQALDALAVLERSTITGCVIPPFTADFMYQELQLSKDWFLCQYLGLNLDTDTEAMLADFFHLLAASAAAQPQVLMHRDYHSANLMVLADGQVGILDFQDAFQGPVTYDLVSLLRDCYIAWPNARVLQWALSYKARLPQLANVSDSEFIRWFDLMGVQRHLKALLTFARKWLRDANPNYLQHIPRTLQYLATVTPRYPDCHAFAAWLQTVVLPAAQQVKTICAQ
jgi:aminoglycoside/choline kinase family phosphotransferase